MPGPLNIEFRKLDYAFVVVLLLLLSGGWQLLGRLIDGMTDNDKEIKALRQEIRGEINFEASRITQQIAELRSVLISCPPSLNQKEDER